MIKLKEFLESHHDRNEGKMAKYDVKEIAQVVGSKDNKGS